MSPSDRDCEIMSLVSAGDTTPSGIASSTGTWSRAESPEYVSCCQAEVPHLAVTDRVDRRSAVDGRRARPLDEMLLPIQQFDESSRQADHNDRHVRTCLMEMRALSLTGPARRVPTAHDCNDTCSSKHDMMLSLIHI